MENSFLTWLWDKEHPRRIFGFGQTIDIQTVEYAGKYVVIDYYPSGTYLIQKFYTSEFFWLDRDMIITRFGFV